MPAISDIAFTPSDQIPAQTWEWIDATGPYACGDATADATWCAQSHANTPPAGVTQRDNLFLWLTGFNLEPADTTFIPKTAAYAGYRTINLAWETLDATRADWCQSGPFNGGECDDGCLFTTGYEMLYGNDDYSTPYQGHPMRSIDGRLKLAIEWLYENDVNADGTNDDEWDDFCDVGGLNWDRIEVGGFSSGAQMASFISYAEPGGDAYTDISLFAVEGGADTCGFDGFATPFPSVTDDFYPDEYNDDAPCGYEGGDPNCEVVPRFLFAHETGKVLPLLPWADTALARVGFDSVAYDVDSDLATPTSPLPFTYNLIGTDFELFNAPTCGEHGAMGADACMVLDFDSNLHGNAQEYYLLPAYLEALCELDP